MIETLTLTDFRNHASIRVQTGGHRNVIITGPNGAGKTAILEAVSMLSGDRGMRGAAYTDVARFGASGGFSVFATLSDDTDICVYFNSGDNNRRAKIDCDASPLSNLASFVRLVWITPREDRIFIDDAASRRAFFDRMAACFDAAHAGRTARLSKLMSERAFALRSGGASAWIDGIDRQIAATATAVAAARIQYAGELNYFLKNIAISVDGIVERMLTGDAPNAAENEYYKYLCENRTLVGDKMIIDGPHKSDFGVFNQALNLPAAITSTGQQKSALIDIVLAHARLIRTKTGYKPLILLDEAAAHLDAAARARVFRELGQCDAQVWATGLDADAFRAVPDAAFVSCADGAISNIVFSENLEHEQD